MKKKKMGKGLDELFGNYGGYDNDSADNTEKTVMQADEASDKSDSGLTTLRTSEIEPDRKQPRKDFDDEAIEELAQSVAQHGILQPILVRPSGEGYNGYKIVAGERRWRAAMRAGLREVPVIIREMTELEATQIALIENLQRESLNPIEEALGYKRLTEEFSMTQEQIAKQVSKPRSVIANSLRLLNLPEGIQKMLSDGDISVGHAKVLAGVEDTQFASMLAEKVKDEKISVRELERLVAQGYITNEQDEKLSRKIENTLKTFSDNDPFLRELELSMSRITQGKVKVAQQKNGKLRVGIEFMDMDELKLFASKLADGTETE